MARRRTKFQLGSIDAEIVSVAGERLPHRRGPGGQMRAGRMSGWSEHSPDGDRHQSGRQDGPGDESFPHLVESVAVMKLRGTGIVHCKPRQSYELVHRRKRPAQGEPMPRERIEPACPVKTISKVSPTWAASMAVRPVSPSRRRARTKANMMRTSWQSATPAKPIRRRRRPNQNSVLPRGPAAPRVGNRGIALPLPVPAG